MQQNQTWHKIKRFFILEIIAFVIIFFLLWYWFDDWSHKLSSFVHFIYTCFLFFALTLIHCVRCVFTLCINVLTQYVVRLFFFYVAFKEKIILNRIEWSFVCEWATNGDFYQLLWRKTQRHQFRIARESCNLHGFIQCIFFLLCVDRGINFNMPH